MKHVFVTGSTGYVGSKLIEELACKGYKVHALYRDDKKLCNSHHKNIDFYKGDLNDKSSLIKAMKGCEGLFHTAAYARMWAKNKSDFYRVNVKGTENVINAAIEVGVHKGVFTSTAGVFGPATLAPVIESQLNPLLFFSDYERTKYQADKLILNAQSNHFNAVIVYPTRIFGPGLKGISNSVTAMIEQYIKGEWHIIPGNGQEIANYTYIDDVVNGHILAYEKGVGGKQYLLGGENLSYNELFKHVKNMAGVNHRLVNLPIWVMKLAAYMFLFRTKLTGKAPLITPAFVRKFSYAWESNCKKACADLGYKPTPFNQALRNTINWIK